ncbi:MAG: cyclic nucleotide-binding domain-containing protein [Deltaproteobacteria bacterium]|nr:cyclic nucleotide-binding domain-containing protein [Deltaproteobacteria bacterium]
MSYEIEFEVRQSDAGAELVPCGKLAETIRAHLAAERMKEAVALLVTSPPQIGDQLIAECSKASRTLRERLADAFFQARDYERAARSADALGDPARAASYLEASYELGKAAALWVQAGDLVRAAALYEKNLDFLEAADLYVKVKEFLRAAECYERGGAFYQAGVLYLRTGRHERAIELLQRVDRLQDYYAEANRLLGSYFERTGNEELAIARYVEVVRSRALDAATLEVHVRLAELYAARGYQKQAEALLRGVLRADPSHAIASKALHGLPAPEGPRPEIVVPAPAAPTEIVVPATTVPAVEVGAAPLDLPAEPSETVVRAEPALEAIWSLPLFAGLAADELRALAALADKVHVAAGGTLIEQDRPGEALYVVLEGKVGITRSEGGQTIELGVLGRGSAVGEMSLVDEGPTSAQVSALTEVTALRFPMERLRQRLAACERTELRVLRVLARSLSGRLRASNERFSRPAERG